MAAAPFVVAILCNVVLSSIEIGPTPCRRSGRLSTGNGGRASSYATGTSIAGVAENRTVFERVRPETCCGEESGGRATADVAVTAATGVTVPENSR